MLKGRRITAAILAVAFMAAANVLPLRAAAEPTNEKATSQQLDFLIYDPSNTRLIGRAHYTIELSADSITISGRSNYLNGKYDVEREQLLPHGNSPRLVSYEHSYFDKRGTRQIVGSADAKTGKSSCISFPGGRSDVRAKVLSFPADTYAGSSVLIPIADKLKHDPSGNIHFHAFDCAPGPRIFEMNVGLQQAKWNHLPHYSDLLKADARPVLGWYDVFLKPFIPVTQFWFDPRLPFGFMGGTMSRYYRGPEIMLVRVPQTLAVPPLAAAAPAVPPSSSPDPDAPSGVGSTR